ncbi:MAG: hypothetical protein Kilf2KO_16530 [Rhodospirillales bacterium]
MAVSEEAGSGAVELLVDSACLLGEGPLWCADRHLLFWVDIYGQRLWRSDPTGQASALPLPGPASFLAQAPEGRLVAGMGRGFVLLDPDSGATRVLEDPLAAPEGTMMNDGKADRFGRVVAGSKHLAETVDKGRAFQLGPAGLRPLPGTYRVFNGPAFSPDGRRIYLTDSPSKTIVTATYDPDGGTLGKMELFAQLGSDAGYPDGMTVDEEGGIWNAEWDGGRITRYHATGDLDRSIAMPVPRPTSLTFGGSDRKRLFVTSARTGLAAADLAAAPLSGGLFALYPGETGIAESVVSPPGLAGTEGPS